MSSTGRSPKYLAEGGQAAFIVESDIRGAPHVDLRRKGARREREGDAGPSPKLALLPRGDPFDHDLEIGRSGVPTTQRDLRAYT